MKQILLLAGLLWSLYLRGQEPAFVISGRSALDGRLTLSYSPENWLTTSIDTILLSDNNTFSKQLRLTAPGLAYVRYAKDKQLELWVRPGDSLTLVLDSTAAPMLGGTAAVYARYFLSDREEWIKVYAGYEKKYPGFDNEASRYSDRYFAIQDSITLKRMDQLKSFFAGSKDPHELQFQEHQYFSLLYSSLYYKLMFSGSDIEKFRFYQDRFNIRNTFAYNFSDLVTTGDPELIHIRFYRDFMNAAVSHIALKKIKNTGQKFNDSAYIDSAMRIIDDLSDHPQVSLALKVQFLDRLIYERVSLAKETDAVSKFYAAIESLSRGRQNKILNVLRNKLDSLVKDTRFKPGNTAPGFSFRDAYGKTYALDDFKGKKLYMDLGASWCGPCIAALPAWNKLVNEAPASSNIVFISLSLDTKEADWRAFLKKHQAAGLRLFAGDGGFRSNFALNYNITAIPHFLLIDETGKIISYRAPGPDSKEIAKLLK